MKKILFILAAILTLSLSVAAQETPPTSDPNFKQLSTSQFWWLTTSGQLWHYKGATYGWERVSRYSDIVGLGVNNGSTLNNNISGNAANALQWRGLAAGDGFTTVQTSGLASILGVNSSGFAYKYSLSSLGLDDKAGLSTDNAFIGNNSFSQTILALNGIVSTDISAQNITASTSLGGGELNITGNALIGGNLEVTGNIVGSVDKWNGLSRTAGSVTTPTGLLASVGGGNSGLINLANLKSWLALQDKEDKSLKVTSLSSPDNSNYPTTLAVSSALGTKAGISSDNNFAGSNSFDQTIFASNGLETNYVSASNISASVVLGGQVLNIVTNGSFGGELLVDGISTFNSEVNVNNNLNVSGDLEAASLRSTGNLDVQGDLFANSNVEALGNIQGAYLIAYRSDIGKGVVINVDDTQSISDVQVKLPKRDGKIALIDDIPKMFTATLSGDGSTYQFQIAHGLSYTPTMVIATANSIEANGKFAADADATYVTISYVTSTFTPEPPPSGTNNLKWTIMVK